MNLFFFTDDDDSQIMSEISNLIIQYEEEVNIAIEIFEIGYDKIRKSK